MHLFQGNVLELEEYSCWILEPKIGGLKIKKNKSDSQWKLPWKSGVCNMKLPSDSSYFHLSVHCQLSVGKLSANCCLFTNSWLRDLFIFFSYKALTLTHQILILMFHIKASHYLLGQGQMKSIQFYSLQSHVKNSPSFLSSVDFLHWDNQCNCIFNADTCPIHKLFKFLWNHNSWK